MPIAKGPDVAVAGIVYRRKHNCGNLSCIYRQRRL